MSKQSLINGRSGCLMERKHGLMTDFSGKPQLDGFKEIRRDQSILTNPPSEMVCQCGGEIRGRNDEVDYWYERYS